LPDNQEREEGYGRKGGWQQQAEAVPRALLRRFNRPEWKMRCRGKRGLLLRLFGAP
jgi:hypothetical protein